MNLRQDSVKLGGANQRTLEYKIDTQVPALLEVTMLRDNQRLRGWNVPIDETGIGQSCQLKLGELAAQDEPGSDMDLRIGDIL